MYTGGVTPEPFVRALGEHRRGRLVADADAAILPRTIRDIRQLPGLLPIKRVLHRRIEIDQHVVRRDLGGRGVGRGRSQAQVQRVGGAPAVDRLDGVVHRHVQRPKLRVEWIVAGCAPGCG